MIYAICHRLGISLFKARSKESALRKAKKQYGEYAEPYSLPENQELEIAWAQQMGAYVHD